MRMVKKLVWVLNYSWNIEGLESTKVSQEVRETNRETAPIHWLTLQMASTTGPETGNSILVSHISNRNPFT